MGVLVKGKFIICILLIVINGLIFISCQKEQEVSLIQKEKEVSLIGNEFEEGREEFDYSEIKGLYTLQECYNFKLISSDQVKEMAGVLKERNFITKSTIGIKDEKPLKIAYVKYKYGNEKDLLEKEDILSAFRVRYYGKYDNLIVLSFIWEVGCSSIWIEEIDGVSFVHESIQNSPMFVWIQE